MAPSLPWNCFQLPLLTDVLCAGLQNQGFFRTAGLWQRQTHSTWNMLQGRCLKQ